MFESRENKLKLIWILSTCVSLALLLTSINVPWYAIRHDYLSTAKNGLAIESEYTKLNWDGIKVKYSMMSNSTSFDWIQLGSPPLMKLYKGIFGLVLSSVILYPLLIFLVCYREKWLSCLSDANILKIPEHFTCPRFYLCFVTWIPTTLMLLSFSIFAGQHRVAMNHTSEMDAQALLDLHCAVLQTNGTILLSSSSPCTSFSGSVSTGNTSTSWVADMGFIIAIIDFVCLLINSSVLVLFQWMKEQRQRPYSGPLIYNDL